mgnify:CR=1 FL=1
MIKRVAILGSTGSIGKALLNIIANDKKNFQIILLTSNKNYKILIKQAKKFKVKNLIITDFDSYNLAKKINNNPKIKISDETDCLLDTGGGIKKIMDENKIEHVFILNCDNLWEDEDTVFFREMIENFPQDTMSLLALTPKDLISGYDGKGDFSFTKDDYIQRYNDTTSKGYVFNGAQIIRKEAFKDLKSNVFSINQVWDDLISKNLIKGYKFNKNVLHLGTTEALKKYDEKL